MYRIIPRGLIGFVQGARPARNRVPHHLAEKCEREGHGPPDATRVPNLPSFPAVPDNMVARVTNFPLHILKENHGRFAQRVSRS